MTADLIPFVRARLDEEEQAVRCVQQPYRLYACEDGHIEEPIKVDDPWSDCNGEYEQSGDGGDHLPNRHQSWALIFDPARVLREIEAKQRILDECDWGGPDHADVYHAVIRRLALPYTDHPDYREGWRP